MRDDASGATAIEFAIVAPLFFAAVFGAIGFAIAIWYWNILEDVSAETARCLAIGSSLCSTASSGCSEASAPICFAQALAAARGLHDLQADQITVDPSSVRAQLSFTTITIDHDLSIFGYDFTLSASNAFPNNP